MATRKRNRLTCLYPARPLEILFDTYTISSDKKIFFLQFVVEGAEKSMLSNQDVARALACFANKPVYKHHKDLSRCLATYFDENRGLAHFMAPSFQLIIAVTSVDFATFSPLRFLHCTEFSTKQCQKMVSFQNQKERVSLFKVVSRNNRCGLLSYKSLIFNDFSSSGFNDSPYV